MDKCGARWLRAGALVAAVALGGAAGAAGKKKDSRAAMLEAMKASFQARGQATLERLTQDEVQARCSEVAASGKPMPREEAKQLEAAQMATVKPPSEGKYFGDWRNGEKIAQMGTGKQFTDDPEKPSGGNCYACHQLSPKEMAYGTMGPSLARYGKLRGNSEGILKYTWSKLWNSQAINACSSMPRFGHQGILTEEQLKDVMALLFDAESPVNE